MVKEKIIASFSEHIVVADNSSLSDNLYDRSRFGEKKRKGKIQYSLVEGLYLLEKDKIEVIDGRGKPILFENYIKKARKHDSSFWIRYVAYREMRDRGYIVKTALKFGAGFRVYDRGVKPGQDHAKWILYPIHESESMSLYEFSAKNRVAHSTKKKILLGVVDDEDDVTFYEIKWVRP